MMNKTAYRLTIAAHRLESFVGRGRTIGMLLHGLGKAVGLHLHGIEEAMDAFLITAALGCRLASLRLFS